MAKKLTMILVVIMLIVGFGVGLIASPFIVTTSNSSTDTVWSNIEKRGYINVGTDPSWPPYEQLDNATGAIVGFEVDLANVCAQNLSLTIHWHDVSFDDIITEVQNGQLDMGVSGFSITADRLNSVSFTIPHTTTAAQLIMTQSEVSKLHITNGTITSLTDIKNLGIKVGTQDGTTEQSELQAAGVDTRSWGSFADAIQDMSSANPSVQAVYAETPITTAWIAQYATQGVPIDIVFQHPYYPCAFVVSKNAQTFLAKFDGAMSNVISTGQLDQLKVKWNA
ncbi:MAG: ABC transporter substrate-binding protein [Candidatus Bathyarchaeia archaeon]|jgi:ABC-type amino acid transport substrate-binding protein